MDVLKLEFLSPTTKGEQANGAMDHLLEVILREDFPGKNAIFGHCPNYRPLPPPCTQFGHFFSPEKRRVNQFGQEAHPLTPWGPGGLPLDPLGP